MITGTGTATRVSAFDAATGELFMHYKGTDKVREMIYLDGILILQIGGYRITAIQADTGKSVWKVQTELQPPIAASDGKAYFFHKTKLVCCDLQTGFLHAANPYYESTQYVLQP